MKVHTLDIDSGERDPVLYSNPSDYVVHLKNPIYDVTKISLISARIHNSQYLIHSRNNQFDVLTNGGSTQTVTIPIGNYNGEELAEAIQNGEDGFDRVIASPDMMGVVGRLGKVLGPRGLMPNPKLGTVTPDVAAAVKAAKAGEVQFRVEKAGVVHAGIAKASFDADKIAENADAFIDAIRKARPSGAKGTFIKKITMSSTMGPGVTVSVEKSAG